jgi:hypothetical protein
MLTNIGQRKSVPTCLRISLNARTIFSVSGWWQGRNGGEVDRRVDGLDRSVLPNEADRRRAGSALALEDVPWNGAASSFEVDESRRQMTPLDTAGRG